MKLYSIFQPTVLFFIATLVYDSLSSLCLRALSCCCIQGHHALCIGHQVLEGAPIQPLTASTYGINKVRGDTPVLCQRDCISEAVAGKLLKLEWRYQCHMKMKIGDLMDPLVPTLSCWSGWGINNAPDF